VNDVLLVVVIAVALGFDFTNGFHDTANAVATPVPTRALTPRMAVLTASVANLAGAFVTTAVAKTVGKDIVASDLINTKTILAALLGAICWNLFTWWFGLPTSSSHALIGGLCGAALASASGHWSVIKWSLHKVDAQGHAAWDGLLPKVILPMISSPIAGLVGGFIVMNLL